MENPPPQPPQDDLIAEALRQVRGATPATAKPSGSAPFSGGGADPAIPKDTFPGYELHDEVHRGGQGVVYRAMNKATGRKVAIKVLKSGPFADHKDLIRFEKEVEILAQLNHPNIVAVQDKGQAAGLHFFVMEYISGRPLDQFLKDSRRDIEEVLALFTKICDAVNAAHLKGVIHRDLKPSNIRVDDRGEPHILDFGLAKSATSDIDGGSGEYRAMTVTGQFIGSLFWASPEQAEGSVAKIDVRTDVYSIGVMLYHALTGHFPYNVLGTMQEVLSHILRDAPARPSTVRRQINDEVETIILKCLAKERDRRYRNAGELGRDIRNYLTGQAIEAKRDSGWYILRKTLGRHQPLVMMVLVVGLSLLIAGLVSAIAWRRTATALADKTDADHAKAVSLEQTRKLLIRSQQQSIALRRLIAASDPERTADPGAAKVLLAAVRETLATARRDLSADPVTLSAVLDLYGRILINADQIPDDGPHPGAETLITEALAARRRAGDPIDLAQSLVSLSMLRWHTGGWVKGRGAAEEALGLIASLPSAEQSAPALREIEGDAHNFLALNLDSTGDRETARAEFAHAHALRVAEFGEHSVPAAEVLSSWARSFLSQGRFSQAIEKLSAADAALSAAAGTTGQPLLDDSAVMRNVVRGNLVDALIDRADPGDAARAVPIAQAALDRYQSFYGSFDPNHFFLAIGHNKLGRALLADGNAEQAIQHFAEAVRIRTLAAANPGDPASIEHLGKTRTNLAAALAAAGRQAQALQEIAAAASLVDTPGTRDSWAASHYQWAEILRLSQDLADTPSAMIHATIAQTARLTAAAPNPIAKAQSAIQVARLTLITTGPDAALAALPAKDAPNLGRLHQAAADLVRGKCLQSLGRSAEAEQSLLAAYAVLQTYEEPRPADRAECRRALAEVLTSLGRPQDAAVYK